MLGQKGEAVESSREPLQASDSLRPVTETTTDWSDENALSNDIGLRTNPNSLQPTVSLTMLQMQTENQQQETESGLDPTSQDLTSATCTDSTDQDLSLSSREEETAAQESPAELPDSEPAAAVEEANEGEEEPAEAPAAPGKKSSTGKTKPTAKRRSGRATNRR